MAQEDSGARVGKVLPGRCGETWAGRRAARTGTATGGRGDRTRLRACAGWRGLGGGEGGSYLSPARIPRGDSGWREIAWAGFFGGLATRVGASRGSGGTALKRLGARRGEGSGRGWRRERKGRFETGPYERWGTERGWQPGCEGGEESEEAEHGVFRAEGRGIEGVSSGS